MTTPKKTTTVKKEAPVKELGAFVDQGWLKDHYEGLTQVQKADELQNCHLLVERPVYDTPRYGEAPKKLTTPFKLCINPRDFAKYCLADHLTQGIVIHKILFIPHGVDVITVEQIREHVESREYAAMKGRKKR